MTPLPPVTLSPMTFVVIAAMMATAALTAAAIAILVVRNAPSTKSALMGTTVTTVILLGAVVAAVLYAVLSLFTDGAETFVLPSSHGSGTGAVTVTEFGARPNDAVNDSVGIQETIDHVAAVGGGRVALGEGRFLLKRTVRLVSGVVLDLSPGTTIVWAGERGGTMFSNRARRPLQRSGLEGGGARIDPAGSAGYIFDLHSPQFSRFEEFEVLSGTADTTVMRIRADAAAATGYQAKRNGVYNSVRNIFVSGTCGRVLELVGASTADVVTLNSFTDISAADVRRAGIRLASWADNNAFEGVMRFNLRANDAVGLLVNDSSTPSMEAGVYNNVFTMLAVDTFGREFRGRRGIVLNKSKRTIVSVFHQDPVAEGAALVDNASDSHSILLAGGGGSSAMQLFEKGLQRR